MIKSNKNYVFVALCLVVFFCIAMLLVVLNFNQSVYADYQDIIDDPNAIVNFNQVFKNDNSETNSYGGITRVSTDYTYRIYGTATVSDYIYSRVSNLDSTHKYYFNCYNDTIVLRITNFNNNIHSPFIFTGLSYFQYAINYYSGNTYDISIKPILIDLTLMFGSGNEPNLQQAQDLFISSYYPFTSGSAMMLSGLSAYVEGYNDALSSFDITYNISDFNTNVYSLNGEMFFSRDYSSAYLSVNFNGSVAFPLGFNFVQGDIFTITLKGVNMYSFLNQYPRGVFRVGYLDDNNNFVPFYSLTNDDMSYSNNGSIYIYNAPSTLDISVVSPANISSIVFKYDYSGTDSWQNSYVRIGAFSLTGKTFNATYGEQIIYDRGYHEAELYYQTLLSQYDIGNVEYNRIYNVGYTAGLNTQNVYTFGHLMSSVVEAPLNAVLSIFNFDFLGYNFKNVITLILTVCIIVAIVRLFLGGNQ